MIFIFNFIDISPGSSSFIPLYYITRLITEPLLIITLASSTLRIISNYLQTNTIPLWDVLKLKGEFHGAALALRVREWGL
jgi:hypothetical protein